jgi:hypothetical protein
MLAVVVVLSTGKSAAPAAQLIFDEIEQVWACAPAVKLSPISSIIL